MTRRWLICVPLLLLLVSACSAQDENDIPLGDVARSLRQEKENKDKTDRAVIDNENLNQTLNQLQSQRFNIATLLFSFDGGGKSFKVSSPDVSCNFSFNANATALLSDPFMPRSVPNEELAKLDGPAVIQGSTLQVSVFNGSAWNIKELIVGLTVLRAPDSAPYGPTMLKPAAENVVDLLSKHPDQTVIYHLKGTAAPQSTTVFTADLSNEVAPDQEWHWAIVGAKGVPAAAPTSTDAANNPATPPVSAQPAAPVPATSSGNPHP